MIKDYAFKRLDERRSDERKEDAIYQRYFYPLVTSAVSLQDRLYEILHERHRPVYLLGKGLSPRNNPGSDYRAYKKSSTIYRLAAMLGWIRACRREFSYLRVADPGSARGIHSAINDFERALSDGTWVERERIIRLCELWQLRSPDEIDEVPRIESLAAQVDNLIWDSLSGEQVEDVSKLNETAQKTLCRSVADCLCSHLGTNRVGDQSMDNSLPDAFAILGIREAWIYRDWQGAIGDVLIQKSESETRKFEVIGFGDFEQLMLSGDPKLNLALERLFQIFDDLDLSIEDRFDARPAQLSAVAKATANLILALDQTKGRTSIVPDYSRARAREILHIS